MAATGQCFIGTTTTITKTTKTTTTKTTTKKQQQQKQQQQKQQSNLRRGRIAVAQGRFSRIRQMASMCTLSDNDSLGPPEDSKENKIMRVGSQQS